MKKSVVKVSNLSQVHTTYLEGANLKVWLYDNNFRFGRVSGTTFNKDESLSVRRYEPDYFFNPSFLSCYEITKISRSTEYKFIFLPPSLVEEMEVPGATDIVKPVLDSFMKDRYLILDNVIYLYYPEFIIKNSIGEEHKITDLVIAIETNEDAVNPEIRGKRFSLSQKEVEVKYRHSHLPKEGSTFQKFCFGGGSSVLNYLTRLKDKTITEADFEVLLATLENYLVWESREGTPHIYLSTLYTVPATEDFRAHLPFSLVKKAALWLLNHPVIEQQVQFVGGMLQINNNPNTLDKFYALELQMIQELQLDSACMDYDPVMCTYLKTTNSNSSSVREVLAAINATPIDSAIINYFKITPRVYEGNEVNKSQIVRRLSPTDFNKILDRLLVLMNQLTPIEDGTN